MQKVREYEKTWDLDVIFPGGSESQEFQSYLKTVEDEMKELTTIVHAFNPEGQGITDELANIVAKLEKTMKKLRESFAFISCLSAQNVKDTNANLLVAKRSDLGAKMGTIHTTLNQKLASIPDSEWGELLQHTSLQEVAFVLDETRSQAKEMLPKEQEVLINDLAVDGYNAWGQMYEVIVGKMSVQIEENGETKFYSVGQAANKLSSSDPEFRKYVFEQISKAWEDNADLFAQTLNHLAGFRLQTYKHRGWEDVLKEPLKINRMKRETLDVMWNAISRNKKHFVKYLNKKAELLGKDKLSIYDISAPIAKTVKKVPYTKAANFIMENFNKFSPKMADFAKMTFEKRWIEAEDRAGKRPGGFCTSFPDSQQTRVFMTYSGTTSNISTLAHELGHAYHQHVMNDIHGMNQRYAMNVAETASTFAEMIVADATVKSAKDKQERLELLEDKLQRSIAFFMNIHARFLFETRFYEERKQGMVSVNRLNELMIEAQKEAYCEALSEYDPNFWSSKLHFHITGTPFYNFPYTFGYLFSLGIYAHATKSDKSFEDDYIALLRDTGRMNVEDLAMKHLNVDLTKPDFWEDAIALCVKDVEEFVSL
ncbi:M3 family oligoendopeptidase [Ornithinibacillus sp. BX22]|uniref:M3 family oligoendopeptidase n=2 Tax=Ornithinibacillus TaxID=484508 RepID=A0A923L3G1_9BACI|nr:MULTISPECIES: M3 family oligoendopeptidase [Ornithinibacillus]MBC5635775.1 M3 family oligoendopeptidase [Ornithinibacillus hominis]MBS3680236.1 M3 family oligoendopeptidase [Ornithinibacillus massiliensis]